MLRQYLETALWSSTYGEDDTPFDQDYGHADFTLEARQDALADCAIFECHLRDTPCEGFDNLWEAARKLSNLDQIGHDFWLTRNGHGAGFWDGDYGDYGDDITQVVKDNFYGCDLYITDDGQVEIC